MKRLLLIICAFIVATTTLSAQNTLGVYGGFGSASEGMYPAVKGRSIYGLPAFGVTWRNYNAQRYIGCFGIDIEYMQRGFSFTPSTSVSESVEKYYYTRHINSIMVPIVWQPHIYLLDRRVRVFMEAAATFNYDLSSTYSNEYLKHRNEILGKEEEQWEGKYEYMPSRDNRLGYGLAGGGGISYIAAKFEVMARVRYYYGYSDVLRNRNKYYSNNLDGAENPFTLTPLRSPLSNFYIHFGISYHFGDEGFKSWEHKKIKVPKMNKGFNFNADQNNINSL